MEEFNTKTRLSAKQLQVGAQESCVGARADGQHLRATICISGKTNRAKLTKPVISRTLTNTVYNLRAEINALLLALILAVLGTSRTNE